MGLLAVCNAYTMRVCLNLAITQMVNNTKSDHSNYDPDACPADTLDVSNGTVIERPVSIRFIYYEPVLTFIPYYTPQ